MHYGNYQNEIYGAGLKGIIPRVPVDFANLERRAAAAMPPQVLSYVQAAAAMSGRRTATSRLSATGA